MIQGHATAILDFLVITCLTDTPDIFFLSFGKDDPQAHFADIDETQTKKIVNRGSSILHLNHTRLYGNLFQILSGLSRSGFMYAGVESGAKGPTVISLWSFE